MIIFLKVEINNKLIQILIIFIIEMHNLVEKWKPNSNVNLQIINNLLLYLVSLNTKT
jgi:hypothetical protein